jgi:GTP-binding protein Era
VSPDAGEGFCSGFATLVGRPNVGKSTLLNAVLGQKVSITSPVAQTTRTQVRGVLTRPDVQIVFVDTPGIHKPRTLLGERLNDTAEEALVSVDVTVFVLDALQPLGKGHGPALGPLRGEQDRPGVTPAGPPTAPGRGGPRPGRVLPGLGPHR